MGETNNHASVLSAETDAVISPGDQIQRSGEQLLPLVYDELRRLARRQMRSERIDHTLQATALVHEAYMHLGDSKEVKWAGRAHFFNAAAEAMRRILVEHARSRSRPRRGGTCTRIPLDVLDLAAETDSQSVLRLEEAFSRFEKVDASAAAVVRLRFFAGLNTVETAEALEISPRTVKREWAFARAWLFKAMSP
jgi:RNA polymerase sigma-70 factor (ECF subfamily)